MMDLGAILAELKAVDDFKQTDKNLATTSFCPVSYTHLTLPTMAVV